MNRIIFDPIQIDTIHQLDIPSFGVWFWENFLVAPRVT